MLNVGLFPSQHYSRLASALVGHNHIACTYIDTSPARVEPTTSWLDISHFVIKQMSYDLLRLVVTQLSLPPGRHSTTRTHLDYIFSAIFLIFTAF
jgi:hypothetical protein